jgi:aspartate/methionine/tyrosine aminotransferase
MRLPDFKLERYFARYEFNVRYTLCSSDCESVSIGELLALEPDAEERLLRHRLGYTESAGHPALRHAICGLYSAIEPDHVLVHSGAEEAIFLLMHAALERGDHLVVHTPCYQSLHEVARAIGCEVTPWQAREPDGWSLDLDELERSIRPDTRLIVLNTPHNPTGYLMPEDLFLAVLRLAERHGIVLFCDEVYRESEHDPAGLLPAACDVSPTAVSLGVLSKTYGLPGLRIGWVATRNTRLLDRMARLKDYTTICNAAPSELLAELALRHRTRLARRNLELILRNLDRLDAFFGRHAERLVWQRPAAGPIAFPRLLGEPVEPFCHRLAAKAGVLLLPGTVYEDEGNHFRIGFGRANLPEALARLEEFLDRPAA